MLGNQCRDEDGNGLITSEMRDNCREQQLLFDPEMIRKLDFIVLDRPPGLHCDGFGRAIGAEGAVDQDA